ncbi:DUF1573 domain-containing protein [bacterium CPR1]|nr:DUF1573 domain-containing protein [bacterium CPR1]
MEPISGRLRRTLRAIILLGSLYTGASLAWSAAQPPPTRDLWEPRPLLLNSSPGPLSSANSDHDFGRLPQGSQVSHVYTITNSSEQPLSIERVQSSCGCTAALVAEKNLTPGQSSAVEVRFTSGKLVGPFHKTVRVYTRPEGVLVLSLRGSIQPDYLADPTALNFGTLQLGAEISRTVLLYPTRSEALWIYQASPPPDPSLEIGAPVRVTGGYQLKVTARGRRPGPLVGMLSLSGGASVPPIFVRYSGRVVP